MQIIVLGIHLFRIIQVLITIFEECWSFCIISQMEKVLYKGISHYLLNLTLLLKSEDEIIILESHFLIFNVFIQDTAL